ncbi:MAG: hypothetical protein LBU32_28635 [Clostridiales bacterium]|nr:hypothetical protein [Clostridiales bacterium]
MSGGCTNSIIVDISWIAECLEEPKSASDFSDSQIRRIAAIAASMLEKGSTGKISGAAERADCRRTALGRFISIGKWDEGAIWDCIKNAAHECMLKHSLEIEKPTLFSFDAAADAEAKPSRQARRPVQGAAHVFFRLEGKAARGRQAAAGAAGCGGVALDRAIQRRGKELGKAAPK